MKTQLHMPHMPHRDGRKHPLAHTLGKLEGGVTDYIVIALVICLGAAMAVGLFTAAGHAPW